MSDFQTYNCDVTETDSMRVYVATEEATENLIAFVMTNNMGQKISILLPRDEVIRLQNQLNDTIINNAI